LDRFDNILQEEIEGYDGELKDLLSQAPAFYRMMTRLLGDSQLPRSMWQMVIASIAYFILPTDVIPEETQGPRGYIDDVFLCAMVADRIRQETGSWTILENNWDGSVPLGPLVEEILSRELELLGQSREDLLQYVGFDELESLK